MIKTTLGQLRLSTPALNELSTQAMPAKTSYWLGKLLRKTGPELESLEQQRLALCKRLGTFDQAQNRYTFPDLEKAAAFETEMSGLLDTEIEIEGVRTLTVEELGQAQVSPGAMAALEWLIVEAPNAAQPPA